jgi:hypothetical protein
MHAIRAARRGKITFDRNPLIVALAAAAHGRLYDRTGY